jgi:LuxR family transcriptional regulator, maltose regulon positive regulatory protein
VSPGIGAAALEVLAAPGVKTADAVLDPVINDFARMPVRVTLVVDDYHLITNQAIQECVEFLVEHMPPTLRLVLATRSDPALPLARLRARGQMTEIRADELRFSDAETEELLNETLGLALPPEEVHALQQRTEGWAAGLYLAGLSLRGRKDTALIIRAFSGDDRQIVDYFAAEVLDGLPPRVRFLLLRTSVLDRLAGPLCDAVTGADGSQRLLEEIERSQLFLVPLDNARHWYRYHTLFADMLRRELDQSEPGLAPLLHRRASEWHRQHGSIAEAIGHAISACDLADARELIASHWNLLVHEGLTETVESWLDRLPPEMVVEDARMCLIRGFLARWLGRLDEVEPWLAAAEATAPKGPFTEGPTSVESAASMLRAGYCHMIGDLAGAEAASRRAVELEAAGRPWWRTVALTTLGRICSGAARTPKPARSSSRWSSLLTRPRTRFTARGRWAAWRPSPPGEATSNPASAVFSRPRTLRRGHRGGGHWMTAIAVLTSADLLAGHGELAEAEQAALSALERAERGRARIETACALMCVARISSQAGNTDDARAGISQARELIGKCAAPGVLTGLLAATQDMVGQHPPTPGPRQPSHAPQPGGLTGREAQVLELLAAGDTTTRSPPSWWSASTRSNATCRTPTGRSARATGPTQPRT